MKKSEEERIKLTANLMNGVALASITLGFFTPLIAALYNLVNAASLPAVILFGSGWLTLALVLHMFALRYLKDLDL